MTLTPSQQEWAHQHLGDTRTVEHTGTITKVQRKNETTWVATVEDDDGRTATFDLATDRATAEAHVGVESIVAVTGTVHKIIEDPDRTEVGLEVKTKDGTAVEWVTPPPMTDAEHAERYPVPTPEEQAAAEAQAQQEQAAAEAERDAAERADFKARLLDLLANDADVQAAVTKAK